MVNLLVYQVSRTLKSPADAGLLAAIEARSASERDRLPSRLRFGLVCYFRYTGKNR